MSIHRDASSGSFSRLREWVRERLWFWPTALGIVAAASAEILVRVDRELDREGTRPLWVFSGTASAARDVLTTIATATMTVLGVTLTIALAVLALTAQTYSPRTLDRFRRDGMLQGVVAAFVVALVFALVALRLVREDDVPGITVNVAVLLAFCALGLLIAFFHHLASEIRVERLIDSVWDETRIEIDRLPAVGSTAVQVGTKDQPATDEVRATRTGRVRIIDNEDLAHLARQLGASIHILQAPGAFVAEDEIVVRVFGGRQLNDAERRRTAGAIKLGTQRTLPHDIAFGIRQLVDIALRALSPGINDPTTAEEAILRTADLLRRLADRELDFQMTESGRLLVLGARAEWTYLVGLTFDQLAAGCEAQADAATAKVLLDAIARVVVATKDPARLAPLRQRAQRIHDGVERAVTEPTERAAVSAAAARVG